MSVEFTPLKSGCFCFGITNNTWFTLLKGPLRDALGPDRTSLTNDPIEVDEDTANACAEALETWTPIKNWFAPNREHEGKAMLIEFFRNCGGFETH